MNSNDSNGPAIYNGEFTHGVDDKRRVQVPACWRPMDPNTELTLVLWPKHAAGACLRVLPPEKMRAFRDEILALPNSDPNKPVLKRLVGSQSIQVTIDKGGRICLPGRMASDGSITVQAVLVGAVDCFEIWNPARRAQVHDADMAQAAKALELME